MQVPSWSATAAANTVAANTKTVVDADNDPEGDGHKVLLEATPAGWEDGSGKMMSLPLFGIPFSSTPVSASMAP